MKIISRIDEFLELRKNIQTTVGFVPTMGALHSGHLSLIRRAKEENDIVIVSIFVNPTQFLEGEDFEKYPKKEDADRKICQVAGVDILFMPTIDQMYAKDELVLMAPSIRGYILEGANRPGHFDGMLQIVLKLLNLTSPTKAYFGKKDAQQLVLITQMVKNYFLPVTIVSCDIIRDEQGLALSSRNVYLNSDEKLRAYALSKSLKRASKMIMGSERNTQKIAQNMLEILSVVNSLEYIAFVNRDFQKIDEIVLGNTIILVAAKVGTTRLIDNIWV